VPLPAELLQTVSRPAESLAALSEQPSARATGDRLRRVAWIGLFVLGLCFWIPALVRARLGASAVTDAAASDARMPVTAPACLTETAATTPIAASQGEGHPVAALTGRLLVTTTILGKTRRAAIVNGRLYREGDKIVAGSERYRLTSVAEDRIELVALAPSAGTKRSVMLQTTAESESDPSGSR
jgi:hypothetical protein